jgi:small subunit ribosomal protein S9
MKVIHTSGKRKRAIARANLRLGSGVVRINSQLLEWAAPKLYRLKISEPLMIAGDRAKQVDINVSVFGGGVCSQADATRVAIGKALAKFDKSLQDEFMKYDRTLLVADVRRKETHKPNCHGKARAKVQKSYR